MSNNAILMKRKYGWRREDPLIHMNDARVHVMATKPLPLNDELDLTSSPHMPDVWDQGQLGSCTAHGNMGVFEFLHHKQFGNFLGGSRLGLYYDERVIDGDPGQDGGSTISTGFKVFEKTGLGFESVWPYVEGNVLKAPPAPYYTGAKKNLVLTDLTVAQADYYIRYTIQYLGVPISFGIDLFEQFESDQAASDGIIKTPKRGATPIGGHCMDIVGASVKNDWYKVRNSWNKTWGVGGYCFIQRAYILSKLASDFRTATAEMKPLA